jgi:hypothetical protein
MKSGGKGQNLRFTHKTVVQRFTAKTCSSVIPAKAGIQFRTTRFATNIAWISAFVGMTSKCLIAIDHSWVNIRPELFLAI